MLIRFWTMHYLTADQFYRLEFQPGDIPEGAEFQIKSDGSVYELIVDAPDTPDGERYIDAFEAACKAVRAD